MAPSAPQKTIRLKPESWSKAVDLEAVFNRPWPFALEVDLGCGKGRFLSAHAFANRGICFLGIDRRRLRIEKMERKALRLGLDNILLLNAEIMFAVEHLLPRQAVSVYYLYFPDPWPKRRHHRRRLFDVRFLNAIHRTLRGKGTIHVATDHPDYYAAIRRVFMSDCRFVEVEPFVPCEDERTDFEVIFMAQQKPVKRCSFMKSTP